LLRDRLIDDLHLFVYPVVLATGARLWAEGGEPTTLVLEGHETYDNGVVHLFYRPRA
jgi:dihydrofolate reductase